MALAKISTPLTFAVVDTPTSAAEKNPARSVATLATQRGQNCSSCSISTVGWMPNRAWALAPIQPLLFVQNAYSP